MRLFELRTTKVKRVFIAEKFLDVANIFAALITDNLTDHASIGACNAIRPYEILAGGVFNAPRRKFDCQTVVSTGCAAGADLSGVGNLRLKTNATSIATAPIAYGLNAPK